LALFAGGGALAQEAASPPRPLSDFSRNANTGVLERARPDYDAEGLVLGDFTGFPTLTVGGEFNDNIFAAQASPRSDTIFLIDPKFELKSAWAEGGLDLYARLASRQYLRFKTETSTDSQIGGQGGQDIGDSRVTASADFGQFTEARTSVDTPLQAVRPIVYTQGDAFLSVLHEFNRIRLSARADWVNFDYRNGVDSQGDVVFQQDRNHNVESITGRLEYALSPDAALLISAVFNDHRYALRPPITLVDRNSHGGSVEFGANFDISQSIRGEVRVGYLQQDFADRAYQRVSGLSAGGRIEWYPTRQSTVTLNGSRSVKDAAVSESPAYIAEAIDGELDYELLRNVILLGRAGYEADRYLAFDRRDRTASGTAGVTYLLNRYVGFTLSAVHLDQRSQGAAIGPVYAETRVVLSTKLQF
jgi:hypothetical protein